MHLVIINMEWNSNSNVIIDEMTATMATMKLLINLFAMETASKFVDQNDRFNSIVKFN